MIKYRSGFERDAAKVLGRTWKYEPFKLKYIIPKQYTPDFVNGKYLVECKGYFRVGDTQKYKAIKGAAAYEGYELVFLLQNPSTRVRKGSKLTLAGWCDKEEIKWYTLENINELNS